MTTESHTPGDLIVGDYPLLTDRVTIAAGANLERGAVLGQITGNGKYILSADGVDGSQTPVAVLATAAPAASADVQATVYVTGEFDVAHLTFGTGQTAATLNASMRARGQALRAVTLV